MVSVPFESNVLFGLAHQQPLLPLSAVGVKQTQGNRNRPQACIGVGLIGEALLAQTELVAMAFDNPLRLIGIEPRRMRRDSGIIFDEQRLRFHRPERV